MILSPLKKIIPVIIFLVSTQIIFAQGIGINNDNTDPDPSAMLHVKSTDKGILVPRMSSSQRTSIASPALGLLVFDTSSNSFWFFNGAIWVEITAGSASNQTLTYTGSTLTISGGNAVNVPNGDITEVVAGNGLVGGGTIGNTTVSVVATNGIKTNADDVRLGGTLVEPTQIIQGGHNMTYNLNGSGDFNIQDNGVTHFQVGDNGLTSFGDDTYWKDGSVSGTNLAILSDDGDDGRFRLMENGLTSIDLDANSQFVFNEQGLDRNFRVESTTNANMMFLDAGAGRLGINTNTPTETFHVEGGGRFIDGVSIGAASTSGDHLMIAAGSVRPTVQIGNTVSNNAESGRLVFTENARTQITNGVYCGFEIHHDGAANKLHINGGCTAPTTSMTFERNGNVGIGTTAPTANLSVNGAANKLGGGSWAVFSDARLKTNVSDYTEGLDFLMKVRTVNFSYNDKMTAIWGENTVNPNKVYQGVIAQELQEIAPDMVRSVTLNASNDNDLDQPSTEASESFLEVDPNKFTYALINAVKEQQAIINELKNEQDSVKKELAELKDLLKAMSKK
ncbi:tail fiber domain-containing protein [Aureispira anguillae]|uniref:Tail fiber domain-containing protein n=1 Tax=Aureispira anguillae TaxID=2864201 RepID=A0A915YLT3_9BACT|nr:tail fiber domain-containing protein [Aureispira anguillae]BDS15583.1 tail fiber domain-containing protein [Aureispira anguillae]